MPAPEPGFAHIAMLQTHPLALVAGALLGYAVMMRTNPAQADLRNGFRALRRYAALWIVPGAFGFCAALFKLAERAYFAAILPPDDRPAFMWVRAAWRDPELWLTGSEQSLWWLPRGDFITAWRASLMPAFESLAGIFNCLVATFPVSALAALLLLLNRGGHHAVLFRALLKRLGGFGWTIHLGIVICALAAIAKPVLYLMPPLVPLSDDALALWFQWSPVIVWLSAIFEGLLGVFVQTYLVLLAYVWVRGLTFTHDHLVDFALRRFSSVMKWAVVILALSTIFIETPLILKNFAHFADWFPPPEEFAHRLTTARAALAALALLAATMQITLIFHSESLADAWRDHLDFLRRCAWPLAWFFLVAAGHFFALHVCHFSVARGVGEGTALWVAWSLLFPWIGAVVGAWLLASWVSLYKRCTAPVREERTQALLPF